MADTTTVAPLPVNRREFLAYAWAASILVALGGTTAAVLWFAYPRFKAGEFGGVFTVEVGKLPSTTANPNDDKNPVGRFWLINTDSGVLALYVVCVHLGCLYKWTPSNDRFECPCHGSKYQRTGEWIEGPAPRNLDRFVIDVVDADGNVLVSTKEGDANADPTAGGPVPIPPEAAAININTISKIRGKIHPV